MPGCPLLVPPDHLLRRIDPVVAEIMPKVREELAPFYSDIGRPSIPETGTFSKKTVRPIATNRNNYRDDFRT